jgi:glycosyltransferase involved in cell wall biosynthesis
LSPPQAHAPLLLYLLPRYNQDSAEHVYHLYGFLRELRTKLAVDVWVEDLQGAPPADLPMRALRFRQPLLRFAEELWRCLRAGWDGECAFYVHYSYTAGLAAAIAARLTGGKAYYWNCGMYAEFTPPRGAPLPQRLREGWNRGLLEACVRWSTHLVTGTPRMAEYYARNAKVDRAKILVLPNFVEAERFRSVGRQAARAALGIPEQQSVFLFLHRVAPRKGAYYLPALAARIKRSFGPARIVVAGDGPYLPILRERARQEGLADMFDFRGWVPNRETPLFFRAADLFIMPSDEEGFPRVLLEAMAAECAFVAFDVGGVRDILAPDQMGCLVPARDKEEFARRCIAALRDQPVREQWIQAGRIQAALFSQERVVTAFRRMIEGEPPDWPWGETKGISP